MFASRFSLGILIIAGFMLASTISGCVIQLNNYSVKGEFIDGHPNIDKALAIISADQRLFAPLEGVQVIAVRDLNVRYNPEQPTCDKRDTADRCFPKCTTDYEKIYVALHFVEASVWNTVACILHENFHQQGGGEADALKYAKAGTRLLKNKK